MKKLVLIFTILAFQITMAGDEVNNGGGLAESNFATAYLNLGKYINYCLNFKKCQLLSEQRQILEKIEGSLTDEYLNQNQLVFLSESENPGTFIIDGELKVAKTGDGIGSPIYINKDLIYYDDARVSKKRSISLAQAVAILVHEFGHHHGIDDHTKLDFIGAKVSMNLQESISQINLIPNQDGIKLSALNGNSKKDFPQVLLQIINKNIDISKNLKDEVRCNTFEIPIPVNLPVDLQLSFKKPVGFELHNLHWTKSKIDKGKGKFTVEGNLIKYCKKSDTELRTVKKYKAIINFEVNRVAGSGKWSFDSKSLEIKEDRDRWWQIIDIPIFN